MAARNHCASRTRTGGSLACHSPGEVTRQAFCGPARRMILNSSAPRARKASAYVSAMRPGGRLQMAAPCLTGTMLASAWCELTIAVTVTGSPVMARSSTSTIGSVTRPQATIQYSVLKPVGRPTVPYALHIRAFQRSSISTVSRARARDLPGELAPPSAVKIFLADLSSTAHGDARIEHILSGLPPIATVNADIAR